LSDLLGDFLDSCETFLQYGKNVELKIYGVGTIDRTILEALSDSCICYAMPLIMVLKTLQRVARGKSEQGVIEIEQLTRVTRRLLQSVMMVAASI